jgi:hypothetical protein
LGCTYISVDLLLGNPVYFPSTQTQRQGSRFSNREPAVSRIVNLPQTVRRQMSEILEVLVCGQI